MENTETEKVCSLLCSSPQTRITRLYLDLVKDKKLPWKTGEIRMDLTQPQEPVESRVLMEDEHRLWLIFPRPPSVVFTQEES